MPPDREGSRPVGIELPGRPRVDDEPDLWSLPPESGDEATDVGRAAQPVGEFACRRSETEFEILVSS